MSNWKDKECRECGEVFSPTGPAAKYCKECGILRAKEVADAGARAYRYREAEKSGRLDRFGIGKGGGQRSGKDSPYYKNGITAEFAKHREQMRIDIQYCERCNIDLSGADRYHWCVHHIDHDRTNNDRSNLIMLCKRCHQLEHDCVKSFHKDK